MYGTCVHLNSSDKERAVLNESEQEQARRVETMARVVSEARSVLKPLVTSSSSDHDKRVRKMPESAFANTFDELHGLLTKAGFARAMAYAFPCLSAALIPIDRRDAGPSHSNPVARTLSALRTQSQTISVSLF